MARAILLGIITVIAIPIAFVQPFGGLCIYLWLAHSRITDFMWWYVWVFQTNSRVALALFIGYLLFEMRRSPPRVKGMWLLLCFWGWLALSTAHAYDKAIAFAKLEEYSRGFVIAFLIAAMANTEKRIRTILTVIAVSIGVLGTKGGIDTIISGGHYTITGPGGMLTEENEFALGLNMAIPLLVLLARNASNQWRRWSLYAMAGFCAVGVIGTHSRSGFLGLIVACLLLVWYSRRRFLAVPGLAVALVLFMIFVPSEALKRYESIPTAEKYDGSAIGRLQAWDAALNMAKAHPIVGVGLRNFVEQFPLYSHYQPRVAHNAFMALIAETGVPGMLIFFAMVASTILHMFWLRRKLRGNKEMGDLADFCLILQVTLTVYLVPVLFINRQDYDLLYHLIGLSAGLAGVVHRRLAVQRALAQAAEETELPAWKDVDSRVPAWQ